MKVGDWRSEGRRLWSRELADTECKRCWERKCLICRRNRGEGCCKGVTEREYVMGQKAEPGIAPEPEQKLGFVLTIKVLKIGSESLCYQKYIYSYKYMGHTQDKTWILMLSHFSRGLISTLWRLQPHSCPWILQYITGSPQGYFFPVGSS